MTTLSTLPRPPSLSLSSESGGSVHYNHLNAHTSSSSLDDPNCLDLSNIVLKGNTLTCYINHSGHTHRPVFPHFDLLSVLLMQASILEVHV